MTMNYQQRHHERNKEKYLEKGRQYYEEKRIKNCPYQDRQNVFSEKKEKGGMVEINIIKYPRKRNKK